MTRALLFTLCLSLTATGALTHVALQRHRERQQERRLVVAVVRMLASVKRVTR